MTTRKMDYFIDDKGNKWGTEHTSVKGGIKVLFSSCTHSKRYIEGMEWKPIPLPKEWTDYAYKKVEREYPTENMNYETVIELEPLGFCLTPDMKVKIDMEKNYNKLMKILPKILYFQKTIEYKMFILWCFSTWLYDRFTATSYLAFLPFDLSKQRAIGVGKSTALEVIKCLGNRSVLASGKKINLNDAKKMCDSHRITLLIDETQDVIKKTKSSGTDAFVWLKTNYKGDNYRFKALAGTEELHTDIDDRSIVIRMENCKMTHEYHEFNSDFDRIRTELYIYNIFYTKGIKGYKGFGQRNRTEEKYGNMIAIAKNIGIEYKDIIEYAVDEEKNKYGYDENNTSYKIKRIIKNASGDIVKQSYIASELGITDKQGQRNLGRTLTKIGIVRHRKEKGNIILKSENKKILG